jgi:hypothetical protein
VFNAYEEEDREVEPGSHGYLRLRASDADRTETKTKKKKGKGSGSQSKDLDPAHVNGIFDTCGISRAFGGLTEYGGCSWTFSDDNLAEKPEEEKNSYDDDDDLDGSEFCITVVDVVDDNGHPFIEFTRSQGMHDGSVTYIGKRQKMKKGAVLEGLTDGERQRLGIFVEEEEIKRVALELGKVRGLGSAAESIPANNRLEDDGDDVQGKDADGSEVTPRKRKAQDSLPDAEKPPCKK